MKSELALLENYRQIFSNFNELQGLATEMDAFGYDKAAMAAGEKIYNDTLALYKQNTQEHAEESEAFKKYEQLFQTIETAYNRHRKHAKVALMKRPDLWKTFAIDTPTATAYLPWLQNAETFYGQVKAHPEAQPLLQRFKLTPTVADEQLARLTELQQLRDAYNKEKGESQDATKAKDAAFARLSDWGSEFYATAKIALEDHPQLLESLGKWMRS